RRWFGPPGAAPGELHCGHELAPFAPAGVAPRTGGGGHRRTSAPTADPAATTCTPAAPAGTAAHVAAAALHPAVRAHAGAREPDRPPGAAYVAARRVDRRRLGLPRDALRALLRLQLRCRG